MRRRDKVADSHDSKQLELERRVAALLPATERTPPPPPTEPKGLIGWMFGWVVDGVLLMLAITNLLLVLMDYTYKDLRHHYQALTPPIVWQAFDHIKGMEPHRSTEGFVARAEMTFNVLRNSRSEAEIERSLAETRQWVVAKIQVEDPYISVGLRGVSEQLKNRVRRHMWETGAPASEVLDWGNPLSWHSWQARFLGKRRPWEDLPSTTSWLQFWSRENLTPERLEAERAWFGREVVPLLKRNYCQRFGEDGHPDDRFWLIDCLFLPLFGLEFVIRGRRSVVRGEYPDFRHFAKARWYDGIYFLPVVVYALPSRLQGPLHLVRMISVGYRMQRMGLINPMAFARTQLARVLGVITDAVQIQILSNYQQNVRQFSLDEAIRSLPPAEREAVAHLIEINVLMLLEKVTPEVLPSLEALISHSTGHALKQSKTYQQLAKLPFFGSLPDQMIQRIVAETLTIGHTSLLKTASDPKSVELTRDLVRQFTLSLLEHMGHIRTEAQLKRVAIAWLDEQKRRIRET